MTIYQIKYNLFLFFNIKILENLITTRKNVHIILLNILFFYLNLEILQADVCAVEIKVVNKSNSIDWFENSYTVNR